MTPITIPATPDPARQPDLLAVIDRLTARLVELEAWKARSEVEFVTGRLRAGELTVQMPGYGPSMWVKGHDDSVEMYVQDSFADEAARVAICAGTFGCGAEDAAAYVAVRHGDVDRVLATVDSVDGAPSIDGPDSRLAGLEHRVTSIEDEKRLLIELLGGPVVPRPVP